MQIKIEKCKCTKCGQDFLPDRVLSFVCADCKKLYASAVIDKEALQASTSDKGIFVRLAETALKSSLDNITAQVVLAAETDWQFIGAQRMLEVVKTWLNIEPIEKEIWEKWGKIE